MDEKPTKGNKTGIVILVVIVVLLAVIGGWYFAMYKPEQEAKEKARLEQIAKEKARKKREAEAAKKKAKYDQLIGQGDQAVEEEYWETAQSAYMQASSLFPKQQYPLDQLTLVNEKLEEIALRSRVGTVETVSSATGRFYVVVSSSIDGDLAMDYGNRMAKEGSSVKIIEPYGKVKFYRVSLDDYAAVDEALAASSSISALDGNGSWILKY